MSHNKSGFTLIELLIVIVTIAILAVIASPMMANMKAKAICSEAVTGISRLRLALAQYRIEHRQYPVIGGFQWLTSVDSEILKALNLEGADLDSLTGRYFSNNCYMICRSSDTDRYIIYVFTDPTKFGGTGAEPNSSQGGISGETQSITDNNSEYGFIRVIDYPHQKDEFKHYNISRSGYDSASP